VRILIISIVAGLCALFSTGALADPYGGLAWVRYVPRLNAFGNDFVVEKPCVLFEVSIRQFFKEHSNARMLDFVKTFGFPADEWDSDMQRQPHQVALVHVPLYHGGHLFRYDSPQGAHLYIWTGEDDDLIMRADYFAPTGPVHPLFLRPL
jgi:hypothetical protein